MFAECRQRDALFCSNVTKVSRRQTVLENQLSQISGQTFTLLKTACFGDIVVVCYAHDRSDIH